MLNVLSPQTAENAVNAMQDRIAGSAMLMQAATRSTPRPLADSDTSLSALLSSALPAPVGAPVAVVGQAVVGPQPAPAVVPPIGAPPPGKEGARLVVLIEHVVFDDMASLLLVRSPCSR